MDKMLVELETCPAPAQLAGERRLAGLDRLAPQIHAIQLQEVEGVEERPARVVLTAQALEHCQPLVVAGHSSSVAASRMRGKRADQSYPLRVSSRTPAGSRRVISR